MPTNSDKRHETTVVYEETLAEGATPPGYDWPTHGGYLGCLVGVIGGCLIGGFIGANLVSFLYISLGLPLILFVALTLVIFVALMIALGRLGWFLGKRFYRQYPQPAQPVWGEDDKAPLPMEQEAAGMSAAPSDEAPDIAQDGMGREEPQALPPPPEHVV